MKILLRDLHTDVTIFWANTEDVKQKELKGKWQTEKLAIAFCSFL